MPDRVDVIIVGGGPAGLSAALVLGRCCRRVVVIDAGNPRNSATQAVHGFLTRDGIFPGEFLRTARAQLAPYDVTLIEDTVDSVTCEPEGFVVALAKHEPLHARKVLLATGVVDRLPNLEGFKELYGRSVHHCPYCDGWEHRNQPVAVYGRGPAAVGLAMTLTAWSKDLVVCSDGPSRLSGEHRAKLAKYGIPVEEHKIARLEGTGGQLERIAFIGAPSIARRAMFFSTGNTQRSSLPQQLGCRTSHKGAVKITRGQQTNVNGLYVAGDAAEDAQFVMVAAAHGARAAMAMNKTLIEEDTAG